MSKYFFIIWGNHRIQWCFYQIFQVKQSLMQFKMQTVFTPKGALKRPLEEKLNFGYAIYCSNHIFALMSSPLYRPLAA